MKLDKKKQLAARALGVGKGRIIFNPQRIQEIAEAITRQDFYDLVQSKAVLIREVGGRRKKDRRKNRGPGKIRKKIVKRKRSYIIMTRKLRNYVKELLKQGKLTKEQFLKARKQIKARVFKSKSHLQGSLGVK